MAENNPEIKVEQKDIVLEQANNIRKQIPINIAPFTGQEGHMETIFWLMNVANIRETANLSNRKIIALMSNKFVPNSAAWYFCAIDKLKNPSNWTTFDNVATAIIKQFCKGMTTEEEARYKKKLVWKPEEPIENLIGRIEMFIGTIDDTHQIEVEEEEYNAVKAWRTRNMLLEVLDQNIKDRMSSTLANMATLTLEELTTAATSARAMCKTLAANQARAAKGRATNLN